jgi:4-amino-4-deoxy-L-arabinose transferase-like glycosyltransferase
MKLHRNHVVAAIILIMIGLSLALVRYLGYPAPLAFCTPAAGVITFFALLTERPLAQAKASSGDERLRQAIAGAVIVQYLVLVGIVAYFNNGADKLPPVTETMLTSFTTVASVVVAFYFGASAFVDAKGKAKPEDQNNLPQAK